MAKLRYKIMADLFLALHVFWIILLVGGTVFMVFNHRYIPYHLVIVSGTLLFNLFLGGCPLTWWEEKYRKMWNPAVYYYPNSFAATYFKRIFNVNVTPRQVNWFLIFNESHIVFHCRFAVDALALIC